MSNLNTDRSPRGIHFALLCTLTSLCGVACKSTAKSDLKTEFEISSDKYETYENDRWSGQGACVFSDDTDCTIELILPVNRPNAYIYREGSTTLKTYTIQSIKGVVDDTNNYFTSIDFTVENVKLKYYFLGKHLIGTPPTKTANHSIYYYRRSGSQFIKIEPNTLVDHGIIKGKTFAQRSTRCLIGEGTTCDIVLTFNLNGTGRYKEKCRGACSTFYGTKIYDLPLADLTIFKSTHDGESHVMMWIITDQYVTEFNTRVGTSAPYEIKGNTLIGGVLTEGQRLELGADILAGMPDDPGTAFGADMIMCGNVYYQNRGLGSDGWHITGSNGQDYILSGQNIPFAAGRHCYRGSNAQGFEGEVFAVVAETPSNGNGGGVGNTVASGGFRTGTKVCGRLIKIADSTYQDGWVWGYQQANQQWKVAFADESGSSAAAGMINQPVCIWHGGLQTGIEGQVLLMVNGIERN